MTARTRLGVGAAIAFAMACSGGDRDPNSSAKGGARITRTARAGASVADAGGPNHTSGGSTAMAGTVSFDPLGGIAGGGDGAGVTNAGAPDIAEGGHVASGGAPAASGGATVAGASSGATFIGDGGVSSGGVSSAVGGTPNAGTSSNSMGGTTSAVDTGGTVGLGSVAGSGGLAVTGGVATGGVATGGVATGGVATGGVATGGVATGGTSNTGGSTVAAPVTPTITTTSHVESGASTLTATVTAHAGMSYVWTASGATITSTGGPAGVTSDGVNGITFTAGTSGSIGLTCAERNSAGVVSEPDAVTITIDVPPADTGFISIVAHPDDELLFINPDLSLAMESGRRTRTVFTTSGDAGGDWVAREAGILSAHAAMANVTNDWSCDSRTYANKSARVCSLHQRPSVTTIFLRLLDSQMYWLYLTPSAGAQSTVDGTNTYTGAELIDVLIAVMNEFQPQHVCMGDSSNAYGDDHLDHIATGAFALLGAQAYGQASQFRMYRAYNIYQSSSGIPIPEPRNLTQSQHDDKVRFMEAYGDGVTPGEAYDEWCWRQYYIVSSSIASSRIMASDGSCLTANGSDAVATTCNASTAQLWSTASDGSLQSNDGICLEVGSDGATVLGASCTGASNQRWTYFENGQIRGPNATCLTLSVGESVRVGECEAEEANSRYTVSAAQRWTPN